MTDLDLAHIAELSPEDQLGYLLEKFGDYYAAAAVDQTDDSHDRRDAYGDEITVRFTALLDRVAELERQQAEVWRLLDPDGPTEHEAMLATLRMVLRLSQEPLTVDYGPVTVPVPDDTSGTCVPVAWGVLPYVGATTSVSNPPATVEAPSCRSHLTGQPWGESWCVLDTAHKVHAESNIRWTDEQACADEGHHDPRPASMLRRVDFAIEPEPDAATVETPAPDDCSRCGGLDGTHTVRDCASPVVDDQDDERCPWGCGRVATGPSTYIADRLCTACAVDDTPADETAVA
jgi:hypothetical protein